MSETLEQMTERLANKFKPLPEGEREAHDKAQAESESRRHSFEVQNIFSTSNAPTRHCKCRPVIEGAWGETLLKLKSKLGTGCLLALIGDRGNGKTQIAVELMRHIAELEKQPKFITATGFFMAIKATYKADSKETEENILLNFSKPTFLVIDEFSKRGGSEWEYNLIFELINRRYNSMKDTLLIANQSKKEFVAEIGPSLASRMNEGGGIVECNWETFRK